MSRRLTMMMMMACVQLRLQGGRVECGHHRHRARQGGAALRQDPPHEGRWDRQAVLWCGPRVCEPIVGGEDLVVKGEPPYGKIHRMKVVRPLTSIPAGHHQHHHAPYQAAIHASIGGGVSAGNVVLTTRECVPGCGAGAIPDPQEPPGHAGGRLQPEVQGQRHHRQPTLLTGPCGASAAEEHFSLLEAV